MVRNTVKTWQSWCSADICNRDTTATIISSFIAELWSAKRVCGAPWVSRSTQPRKFFNHVTVHFPSVRTTGQPMFSLTLSIQFGSTGSLILHTYCTLMLWSIDSCQNRVSSDQYHLTVSPVPVSTYRGRVSFLSYSLTSYWFSNDCRLKFNFL